MIAIIQIALIERTWVKVSVNLVMLLPFHYGLNVRCDVDMASLTELKCDGCKLVEQCQKLTSIFVVTYSE